MIAENEEEAEAKLREELRLGSLPCEFKEVEIPGYIILTKQDFINATSQPIMDDDFKNLKNPLDYPKPKK